MYLEFSDNNGKKYIRICETNRVFDPAKNKYVTKKKTIKNIGPVSKFDDGKPDYIGRLKASFLVGKPILEELKPYVCKVVPQEVYNIRLTEGTDDCVADPKLIANSLLESILEDLDISQLVRSYKNIYNVNYDVYGLFKLLIFGRILSPASKWSTMKQLDHYYTPIVKGDVGEYDIYRALDFIYEHRNAIFNRIDKVMTTKYKRVTDHVFYDVTNFYYETDDPDEDVVVEDEITEPGFRKKGVCKENRKQPIVQMGLIMDKDGIPISSEAFPGNTLDHLTLAAAFKNSVSSLQKSQRYIFVSDKGIGKGSAISYAIESGNGYLTSRTVRGSSKNEKAWILEDEYIQESENFKYKTRIVKKKTTSSTGQTIEYAEKVLTYWSREYYEREKNEKKSFFEFAQKLIENPTGFKFDKTTSPLVRKYLKKNVVNKKTGELLKTSDLSAVIDMDSLKRDYELLGYYTLATSEINMPDKEMLQMYGNLVEIEDQFRVMKSTLETRPMFVRTKEHIIAHLTVCTIALIVLRMIQRKIKTQIPATNGALFTSGLSADRIQTALNKWTVEKIGDVYYRFGGINDPDLLLILNSFGITIPKKCYKLGELKAFKGIMKMSM